MRTAIAQRAYIAGFIEGEGSFTILTKRKIRKTSFGYYYKRRPQITVAQKNRKPLEFIQRFYGGGISSRRHKTGTWRYYLSNSHGLMRLVKDIYPFLIASRARYRAACIYKFASLMGVSGHHISQENRGKREQVYELWSKSRR